MAPPTIVSAKAACALVALITAGCSSLPSPAPGAGAPPTAIPSPSAASPWELPEELQGSQRLFRVRFEGEDGDGKFRLTLRLLDSQRFQLRAVDPLGRSVWTLHAEGGRSLLLEHRERRACTFGDQVDLDDLYLGSFPARDLPALILGRVPAVPEGSPLWSEGPEAGEDRLEFADLAGRRWVCRLQGGEVRSWSLKGAGGGELASLHREEEELHLIDRRRGIEVRWREVAAEPLQGGFARPEIPSSYEEGECF